MTFENHVGNVIRTEIKDIVNGQGYVLETEFCLMICQKYGFSHSTVIGTLRQIYAEIPLIKRRMSAELKEFYKVQRKGCPIAYLPVKETPKQELPLWQQRREFFSEFCNGNY